MQKNVWERRPEESEQAFYAFTLYRDMGLTRSLRGVQDKLSLQLVKNKEGEYGVDLASLPRNLEIVDLESTQGATPEPRIWVNGRIKSWSRAHDWVERSRAYDGEIDRRVAKRQIESATGVRLKHQKATAVSTATMSYALTRFINRLSDPVEQHFLDQIPIEDLLGIAMEASTRLGKVLKAEMIAHGVVVTKGEETESGPYRWEIGIRQPERKEIEEADEAEEVEADDPWQPDPPPAT